MDVRASVHVILLILLSSLGESTAKKIIIKKFEMCDRKAAYPFEVHTSFALANDIQFVTANLTISEDLGDKIMIHMQIFLGAVKAKKLVKIGDVKDNFCKMARNYLGPFLDDLEKAAQILPGVCPIPKGTYHVTHFPININKMFLSGIIPYGYVKFMGHLTSSTTGRELLCYNAEIQVS